MFREFHYQSRGRGHALKGGECQDRTRYVSRGGAQVMCLADGAGSAALSHFGAQALVDEGCAFLANAVRELLSTDDGSAVKVAIVQGLLEKLTHVAAQHQCEVKDLAATFLAVAVIEDRFLVVHVGDGVIGYEKHGDLRVISTPDNAEFANQTAFVTSERAAAAMRLYRGALEGVTGFVLMSDGAGSSLYDLRSKSLASACAKIISLVGAAPTRQVRNPHYKKQLRRLIDTRVRAATSDDCSVGVLGRRSEEAPASVLLGG